MKDFGKMIRLVDSENIFTKMVLSIKENGLMINNMVMVKRNGLMELFIKVSINSEKRMVKVLFNGQIIQVIKENLRIIK